MGLCSSHQATSYSMGVTAGMGMAATMSHQATSNSVGGIVLCPSLKAVLTCNLTELLWVWACTDLPPHGTLDADAHGLSALLLPTDMVGVFFHH